MQILPDSPIIKEMNILTSLISPFSKMVPSLINVIPSVILALIATLLSFFWASLKTVYVLFYHLLVASKLLSIDGVLTTNIKNFCLLTFSLPPIEDLCRTRNSVGGRTSQIHLFTSPFIHSITHQLHSKSFR